MGRDGGLAAPSRPPRFLSRALDGVNVRQVPRQALPSCALRRGFPETSPARGSEVNAHCRRFGLDGHRLSLDSPPRLRRRQAGRLALPRLPAVDGPYAAGLPAGDTRGQTSEPSIGNTHAVSGSRDAEVHRKADCCRPSSASRLRCRSRSSDGRSSRKTAMILLVQPVGFPRDACARNADHGRTRDRVRIEDSASTPLVGGFQSAPRRSTRTCRRPTSLMYKWLASRGSTMIECSLGSIGRAVLSPPHHALRWGWC